MKVRTKLEFMYRCQFYQVAHVFKSPFVSLILNDSAKISGAVSITLIILIWG